MQKLEVGFVLCPLSRSVPALHRAHQIHNLRQTFLCAFGVNEPDPASSQQDVEWSHDLLILGDVLHFRFCQVVSRVDALLELSVLCDQIKDIKGSSAVGSTEVVEIAKIVNHLPLFQFIDEGLEVDLLIYFLIEIILGDCAYSVVAHQRQIICATLEHRFQLIWSQVFTQLVLSDVIQS